MEKVDGTSSHVTYHNGNIKIFAGGANHESFSKLFNEEELKVKFAEVLTYADAEITVFGEAYGGKIQKMSETYGKELRFIAFEVKIGESWLDVVKAEAICQKLGFEFVPYKKVSTELASLDAERDADSTVAVWRGMGAGKKREGVILRPLIEVRGNSGSRIIAKHKRAEWRETATERPVKPVDPEKQKLMDDAALIAQEWVTVNRFKNILSHLPDEQKVIDNMGNLIKLIIDDVIKEARGEILDSKEVRKALGGAASKLIKSYFTESFRETFQ